MISKHISYKEGVYSNTAIRRGIENTPNEEQLTNMKVLAEKVFYVFIFTKHFIFIPKPIFKISFIFY